MWPATQNILACSAGYVVLTFAVKPLVALSYCSAYAQPRNVQQLNQRCLASIPPDSSVIPGTSILYGESQHEFI